MTNYGDHNVVHKTKPRYNESNRKKNEKIYTMHILKSVAKYFLTHNRKVQFFQREKFGSCPILQDVMYQEKKKIKNIFQIMKQRVVPVSSFYRMVVLSCGTCGSVRKEKEYF